MSNAIYMQDGREYVSTGGDKFLQSFGLKVLYCLFRRSVEYILIYFYVPSFLFPSFHCHLTRGKGSFHVGGSWAGQEQKAPVPRSLAE